MADTPTDTVQTTPDKTRAATGAQGALHQRRGAKRNRSLDGLAGLAIIGVLGHALGAPGLAGGHLGTTMLLTIAGYALTSAQLKRVRRGISAIGGLWKRDLACLWPPMAIVCALTALACLVFQRPLLEAARPDMLPALALVENLSYANGGMAPYGAAGSTAATPPFAHLWLISLAAQTCLVWPLMMQLFYATLPTKRHARRLTLVLALVSAIGMALFYGDGGGLSRAYFGPDTRAFAPLLGAWLAYAIPLDGRCSRDARTLAKKLRPAIEVAAIVSLAAIATCMHDLPVDSALIYRGGALLVSLLTLAVIATIVLPGGMVTKLVSLQPLKWLGARAICIYLWHLPLICLLGVSADAPWWKALVAVVLTLAASEATTRALAVLARLHGPLAIPNHPRAMVHRPVMLASSVMAGVVALALVGATGGMGTPPASTDVAAQQGQAAPQDSEPEDVVETEEAQKAEEERKAEEAQKAEDEKKKSEPARIMLIGNSFTYYNDLAGKIVSLSGAQIDQETKGGAHLSDHLDASSELGAMTMGALDEGTWDYVVIQEMSTTPMEDRERYLADLKALCDIVRKKGATPIIYATWAYPDTEWGAAAHDMSVEEMGNALQASFEEAGKQTGAPVANVGKAFADKGYADSLYAEDGKHPSEEGTQLAAEVIAKTIEEAKQA